MIIYLSTQSPVNRKIRRNDLFLVYGASFVPRLRGRAKIPLWSYSYSRTTRQDDSGILWISTDGKHTEMPSFQPSTKNTVEAGSLRSVVSQHKQHRLRDLLPFTEWNIDYSPMATMVCFVLITLHLLWGGAGFRNRIGYFDPIYLALRRLLKWP